MATGRTHAKYTRLYADGYDWSGDTRTIGPLSIEHGFDAQAGLSEEVKGGLCGHGTVTIGTLNGSFNSADGALHTAAAGAGSRRTVLIPIGIRAAPAAGDPAFCGTFEQGSYMATPPVDGDVTASIEWVTSSAVAALAYAKAWGRLLHAKGSETAANSATGGVDNGASSAAGGYFVYQLFSVTGTGTVTLSVDDSSDDSSYSALSGATSGAIAHGSAPTAGIIQLGTTASVARYLRFQVAFSGITAAVFASAFVRG